jgi:malate dehydrogenase (oxaloacetate-decarboxylating)
MAAEGLSYQEATQRFWCIGRHGLLTDARADLRDFQVPYARAAGEVSDWEYDESLEGVNLEEVVRRVRPTILIGTSGLARAFTETAVREMARHAGRPIIMPMSNPTSLAEATPADLLEWTEGRVLVATGSPFKPVEYDGRTYKIAQANNALVFPGLGLGVFVAKATRLTDGMLQAAARAVAKLVDADELGGALLPEIADLRATSAAVAVAVARAAQAEGVARVDLGDDLAERVHNKMWQPVYPPVHAV